ncbi:MAG: tetratricopeptide repeat protein [Candidatus Thiodiazotropha lotti]|uniref:tetratricopeptide repeat protein n=1 Tax=Candidatus Thiodiazotropha endoloripes TaxID=1818881 RepID=UPI00138FCF71|nr:tetratricopeptide repeat protein [Candidatus Thiodiazotropha endoloripes]MCG7897290.1 tetratricopeptide repeat protein [Candidatus Thiodiazotropha weberae]MCG7993036.1 tetratricopeptide repeat protein [Candidatus Thiodiazotropha lotti]MCG7902571.1 tetratricopeptide repeat protein [Candidatus Thiodiazotropha weberae]MCG7913605.1 tetratricopeptide repeat protein [Candidatus Thiodiazotropha weberae]MCG8000170.1 tetratricopeptide repeat protein [Candidatus Thiodiazotropha lotti]
MLQTRETPAPVKDDSLEYSRQLVAKGRYSEAIHLLNQASVGKNNNQTYIQELKSLRGQQKIVEEELNDQLLISNTSALKNQLPILVKLTKSSDNPQYLQLLEQTQAQLQSMRLALSDCGWRHYKRNNALAKDCLSIALSLKLDESDQNLMDHLLKEQSKNKQALEKKEKSARQKRWKEKLDKRLAEANRLLESGQLRDAKHALQKILKDVPKNSRASEMLAKVNRQLQRYIDNLLSAGDRLYRDGEIESAKATWRAALALDPQDLRAREKIQRAQRVLNNLENLRKTN